MLFNAPPSGGLGQIYTERVLLLATRRTSRGKYLGRAMPPHQTEASSGQRRRRRVGGLWAGVYPPQPTTGSGAPVGSAFWRILKARERSFLHLLKYLRDKAEVWGGANCPPLSASSLPRRRTVPVSKYTVCRSGNLELDDDCGVSCHRQRERK